MLAFVLLSTITYLAEGSGGFASTKLTQSLSQAGTTAYVDSTSGFDKAGTIKIGSEEIYYNGTTATAFLHLDRAQNDTDANAYSARSTIYSNSADALNSAMGMDFVEQSTDSGWVGVLMIPKTFIVDVVPDIVMWDFSILKSGAPMQMFRTVLFCFSVGFIVWFAYLLASMVGSIGGNIISRL